MSAIKFKIAAKTDVGRVRQNNEDNFQAARDLTTAPMTWLNDEECTLGDKGALLVVADGMGGMNAGEVASEIAINTIKEFFSPNNITEDVIESKVGIETFMKRSIVEADKRIKAAAKSNPEHRGMGTTIVIGWLLEDSLYVAWCGDSRAYIYNRINGLRQISKDHSYVQSLVDKGKISHEDAFDYPDSNIITRCLSDSDQKARPDTLDHPLIVHNGDIILLCTDGLNGMIRDHEIEQILNENETNLSECTDKLIEAASEAAGQDNITVALCRIISGATEPQRIIRKNRLSNTLSFAQKNSTPERGKLIGKIILVLLIVLVIFGGGFWYGQKQNPLVTDVSEQDSTMVSIRSQDYTDTINLLHDFQQKVDSLENAIKDAHATISALEKKLDDSEKILHGIMLDNVNEAKGNSSQSKSKNEENSKNKSKDGNSDKEIKSDSSATKSPQKTK